MSKKSLLTTAAALTYAVALSTGSFAADTRSMRDDPAKDTQTYRTGDKERWGGHFSLDKVKGKNVRDAKGEHVGEIEEVVFDSSSGKIDYLILASGGVLGLGEKKYAVPFQAFRFGSDKDDLTINVDQDKLKNAPEARSDMAYDRNFADEVDQYYGVGPVTAPSRESHTTRPMNRGATAMSEKDRAMAGFASFDHMKEMKVTDTKGEDIGKVDDVVFDPSSGRIGYFILASGGALGLGEKDYVIPFQAFQWKQDQTLALNVDKEKLKNAPEARSDMAYDSDFVTRVDQYYGVSPSWGTGRDRGMMERDAGREHHDKDVRGSGK